LAIPSVDENAAHGGWNKLLIIINCVIYPTVMTFVFGKIILPDKLSYVDALPLGI
jgi:hypothetical protein